MLLREYWLNRISLFCAILGILILGAYSILETPKRLEIGNLSDKYIGTKVNVRGVVISSRITEGAALFKVGYKKGVQCVIFKPKVREKILLQKGNFVEVIGRVKSYNGKIEIVAETVNLLD